MKNNVINKIKRWVCRPLQRWVRSCLLNDLALKYERISKRAFLDAEKEKDPTGKSLIEKKAIIYFNCANEVRAILKSPSLLLPTVNSGGHEPSPLKKRNA